MAAFARSSGSENSAKTSMPDIMPINSSTNLAMKEQAMAAGCLGDFIPSK